MKILLHSCCGPCSVAPLEELLQAGHEVTAFFYNPNIHPYKEYFCRRDAWLELVNKYDLPYIIKDDYSLEEWLKNVAASPCQRCAYCYRLRLSAAAEEAKKASCDAFSSSLLISPYQKHDLIKEIGQAEGEGKDVGFYYQDWRPLFRAGQQKARQQGLYMQKYCACIYSEKERYYKK
ncbi:MAG: epoxyqueuosine reductase QueH [Bacillota bacterium]|jgi:predicted adenine nucleotide alpha hydrolase (AANH) superfamily ATPase